MSERALMRRGEARSALAQLRTNETRQALEIILDTEPSAAAEVVRDLPTPYVANLVAQDAACGSGAVLALLPAERAADVVIADPRVVDSTRPSGYVPVDAEVARRIRQRRPADPLGRRMRLHRTERVMRFEDYEGSLPHGDGETHWFLATRGATVDFGEVLTRVECILGAPRDELWKRQTLWCLGPAFLALACRCCERVSDESGRLVDRIERIDRRLASAVEDAVALSADELENDVFERWGETVLKLGVVVASPEDVADEDLVERSVEEILAELQR